MSRRVVVTGSRKFGPAIDVVGVLEALTQRHAEQPIVELGVGDAPAVDAMARAWAIDNGVPYTRYLANWYSYGHAAGPIRNGTMLREFKPDVVLAFPGGTGTADCVKQARAMKIPVLDALTGEVLA